MDKKIKQAAAIAGVIAYIRGQEDAACMQAAASGIKPKPLTEAPSAPVRLWGVNGRQTQMLMRNHMQLKAYHRI